MAWHKILVPFKYFTLTFLKYERNYFCPYVFFSLILFNNVEIGQDFETAYALI